MTASLDIDTTSGRVSGTLTGGPDRVRVWRGLPYAAAPIGELRWRAPQAAPRWTGVRQATAFGADSMQAPMPASQAAAVNEDGLYLNVWSPVAAEPAALPVMVWIHGGGFTGGSGADARSEGSMLAAQGVVVVSFNYRTGLFGYLAHPALSAETAQRSSGNYGLLDQLAALAWVRDNIAGFGGDPANITVFGVSAGSASISLLLVSPLARGLFQQAILHSPGCARPLASLADAEQAGRAIGDDIAALRRLPATELLALTHKLAPAVRGLTTPRVLRPIRDGWLIPEDERPAFLAGRLQRMPIIVGTNLDEGSLLTQSWPVNNCAELQALLQANFPHDVAQALATYPADTDPQARPRVAEAFADTQFNYGARLLVRSMARVEPRTWRYLFTRRRPGQADGPHHGDEVAYVFGQLAAGRGAEALAFDAVDLAVSQSMIRAWVAFARHGDPNGAGPALWPAYREDQDLQQVFGDRSAIEGDPRRQALDFLEQYFSRI